MTLANTDSLGLGNYPKIASRSYNRAAIQHRLVPISAVTDAENARQTAKIF